MGNKKFDRYYHILSFILASLAMYVLLTIVGVTGNGPYTVVRGDMMFNYIPAIRDFVRDIRNGSDIFYTWNYGLGTNTALNNAYYSYSPFNLLYLLFYNKDMNAVTIACIVIKTGLAALGFQLFVSKAHGVKSISSVIFAIFYSLCSFQVAFNIHNIIWLDALYMLPIVLLRVNRLVFLGKWKALTIACSYIFISHFYMGYMIGIASLMYLGYCLYAMVNDKDKKAKLRIFLKYVMAVVLAIGISAVTWLPTLYFLISNATVGTASFSKIGHNLLDIYNQLFWGEVTDFDAKFPYVYCGIPALLLLPLFFMDKENSRKKKIGVGTMLTILVLSCVILPLYAVWHGFNDPFSYAYRFSYLISMLLCTVGACEASKADIKIKKCVFFVVGINILVYITELFWQKQRFAAGFCSNTWMYLGINVALMAVWTGAYLLYKKQAGKTWIAVLLVILAMAEAMSNGLSILGLKGQMASHTGKNVYAQWYESHDYINSVLAQDDSFYRVNFMQDMNPSSGLYFGYNSMSYFTSAENAKVHKTLSKLGMWSSESMVYVGGLTPVTKMLLSVKYDIHGLVPYEEDGVINYTVTGAENENILSLGYMVAGRPEDYDVLGSNAFENGNRLLSVMTGEDIKVYDEVAWDDITVADNGIGIEKTSDGVVISSTDDEKENPGLELSIEDEQETPCYIYIDNEESSYNPNTFFMEDYPEQCVSTDGSVTVSYIKEMGIRDGRAVQSVVKGKPDTSSQSVRDILVARYDNNELLRAYDTLCSNELEVQYYTDGHVYGVVRTDDTKNILFTSIPYEKGWTAYVDGQKAKIIPLIDNTFVGLEISDAGEHSVEMKYRAPGETIGLLYTIMSIITYGMLLYVYRSNVKKRMDK